MPDEMIKTYTAVGRDKVSLHKTLKDYIKLQNKIAEDFKREDDGFVYSCLVYYMREFEPQEYVPYKTLNVSFVYWGGIQKFLQKRQFEILLK